MKNYKLSFGNITIIEKNIAEVIVYEGVVVDEVMIDEYHDFLLNYLQAPFSLLINKRYSYSYNFAAQKIIGNLKEIKAIAVVVGTNAGLMSTETLINMNANSKWNINLFHERDEALCWLLELAYS